MARARNIKPGFFRNADLVELPFEARLLFIGLWTLADREGRLEDRPKQIKMEVFPADNVDCDALIEQLASIGVVARYTHDGKRYLQVVNFCKHQNPHRDEKPSTIPDQSGNLAAPKETPTKHRANTVQAQWDDGANTVAIGLIPDSLIPESCKPLTTFGGAGGAQAQHEPEPDAPPLASPRRGNRLPKDWTLPSDWEVWALHEQPTWSPEHAGKVAAKFRDYWVARPGKDGVKLDWEATWRNWVRRETPLKGAMAKAEITNHASAIGGYGRIL